MSEFLTEEIVQVAVCKCIEAVGEAAGRLLTNVPDFCALHLELELQDAYRTRNRLAHGYDSIDWSDVWIVASEDLPRVLMAVRLARNDFAR